MQEKFLVSLVEIKEYGRSSWLSSLILILISMSSGFLDRFHGILKWFLHTNSNSFRYISTAIHRWIYTKGLMASFALLSTIYVTDSFLCFNRDQTTEIHYNRKLCCLTQNMKIGMLPVYLSYYNKANLTNIFNLRHAYWEQHFEALMH